MESLKSILKGISNVLKGKLLEIEGDINPQDFRDDVLKIASDTLGPVMIGSSSGFSSDFSVIIKEGITSVGDNAYKEKKLTSVVLPRSLQSIGAMAFYKTSITTTGITEENTALESIGDRSFGSCNNITNIYIPQNVSSISSISFLDCSNIEEIKVHNDNQKYTSKNENNEECNAIFERDSDGNLWMVVLGCINTVFPDNISAIGNNAFRGARFETVYIPDTVKVINGSAFQGCKSLKQITLPTQIDDLKSQVLSECSSLESITIPDSVTTIGFSALSFCTKLSSVQISKSLYIIGNNSFQNCTSLTEFILPKEAKLNTIGHAAFSGCSKILIYDFSGLDTPPTLQNVNAFDGASSNMKIVVKDGNDSEGNNIYDKWINATNWKEFGPNRSDQSKPERIITYTDYQNQLI